MSTPGVSKMLNPASANPRMETIRRVSLATGVTVHFCVDFRRFPGAS